MGPCGGARRDRAVLPGAAPCRRRGRKACGPSVVVATAQPARRPALAGCGMKSSGATNRAVEPIRRRRDAAPAPGCAARSLTVPSLPAKRSRELVERVGTASRGHSASIGPCLPASKEDRQASCAARHGLQERRSHRGRLVGIPRHTAARRAASRGGRPRPHESACPCRSRAGTGRRPSTGCPPGRRPTICGGWVGQCSAGWQASYARIGFSLARWRCPARSGTRRLPCCRTAGRPDGRRQPLRASLRASGADGAQ